MCMTCKSIIFRKITQKKFFFMWTKRTKLVLAVISRSVDHPGGKVGLTFASWKGGLTFPFNMTPHWHSITGASPDQQRRRRVPPQSYFLSRKRSQLHWSVARFLRTFSNASKLLNVESKLWGVLYGRDCMSSSEWKVLSIPVILCQWIAPLPLPLPPQFCRSHLHPLCVLYWPAKASTGCF